MLREILKDSFSHLLFMSPFLFLWDRWDRHGLISSFLALLDVAGALCYSNINSLLVKI
jgi:hypothetical protein